GSNIPFDSSNGMIMRLSDITNLHTLFQRSQRVTLGNKLLPHKTGKTSFVNSLHDSRVIQLLCFVNFVSAWYTSRMIMTYILVIFSDSSDDISFHNLHVVNIIKQFNTL